MSAKSCRFGNLGSCLDWGTAVIQEALRTGTVPEVGTGVEMVFCTRTIVDTIDLGAEDGVIP
jgi:hypothetical protein